MYVTFCCMVYDASYVTSARTMLPSAGSRKDFSGKLLTILLLYHKDLKIFQVAEFRVMYVGT